MARAVKPLLLLLTLLAAGGSAAARERLRPLPAPRVQALREQEVSRTARVEQSMLRQKAALGLGADDGLAVTSKTTDAYGETHVHFRQTYKGVKVWNSHLIGHMDASGALQPAHATVQRDIALAGGPLLDAARIEDLALAELSDSALTRPLRSEQIVFPTRYQDGLKLARTPDGSMALDTRFSVGTPRVKEPYVWAWHVSARQRGAGGPEATELIIDGRTGRVLKKWDGLNYEAARGTGHSQYNGDVTVDAELLEDGSYRLRDTTRATKEWPDAQYWGYPELQGVGMRPLVGNVIFATPFTGASNEWGDGLPYAGTSDPRNWETAAVDALYAGGVAWDYYQNVLGRAGGIDGLGSSPILWVHEYTSDPYRWNNAAWDQDEFAMLFGDGAETGALTTLDVTGHELSHGVFGFTAKLDPGGESGGVNEANSDVHAAMMKFYRWGAGGKGDTVPDTVTASPDGDNDPLHVFTIGGQLSKKGEPLRWFYKPSLDGYSYDGWFDGIGLDDVHFTSGPGNRAFYFLAQGASSDPSSVTYSPYLPGGMTGLGNDQAIKIWFHAMATKVTDPASGYQAIRAPMIESARELYGEAAVAAVENAFAAINVGAPAGGPEPLTVMLPVDPVVAANFADTHLIVVPRSVPTRLPAPLVNGAPDTNVTWSLGGMSMKYPVGGRIVDGLFLAPEVPWVEGDWPVRVTSNADPRRYAAALIVSLALDCDSDTEVDAIDLGALALEYGTGRISSYPAAALAGGAAGVSDLAVTGFLLGFHNAYTH